MEIAEFLLARIAEDEAVARAARGAVDALPVGEGYSEVKLPEVFDHVARWDPARVLAECEAKRRIVGIHQEPAEWQLVSDMTLRVLALPYADRNDYRPEWRP
jgi:hypothetical protein